MVIWFSSLPPPIPPPPHSQAPSAHLRYIADSAISCTNESPRGHHAQTGDHLDEPHVCWAYGDLLVVPPAPDSTPTYPYTPGARSRRSMPIALALALELAFNDELLLLVLLLMLLFVLLLVLLSVLLLVPVPVPVVRVRVPLPPQPHPDPMPAPAVQSPTR